MRSKPGRYSARSNWRGWLKGKPTCYKCANEANPRGIQCPAVGRRCLKCGGPNHYARVCTSVGNRRNNKQTNQLELDSGSELCYVSREEENTDVCAYQLNASQSSNPTVDMQVNGTAIRLQLDTQADITVITERHIRQMRNTTLEPTRVKVRAYSGASKGRALPLRGKFNAGTGNSVRDLRTRRSGVTKPNSSREYGSNRISFRCDCCKLSHRGQRESRIHQESHARIPRYLPGYWQTQGRESESPCSPDTKGVIHNKEKYPLP